MGEEREQIRTGDEPEKVIASDEVEGHQLTADEREAVRGDDEVEGHVLVEDMVRDDNIRGD